MGEETRDFARELARDLTPVERIGRLRMGLLRVFAGWALAACAVLLMKGISANLSDPTLMFGGLGALLLGLALVGLGGLVAALASSVPGREGTARMGAVTAACGALVALGLGATLLVGSPATSAAPTLYSDVACFLMAVTVALLPAMGALLYVARAVPRRPGAVLFAVGLGAVGLGAFTAEVVCMDMALRHLIVSHALAPALGALLLLGPLWLGLRRIRVG